METHYHNIFVLIPESPFYNQLIDIIVDDDTGTVNIFKKENQSDGQTSTRLFLLPGIIDVLANFNTPGNEQKEDFITGAKAAIFGGVTHVMLSPDVTPTANNATSIDFVINANESSDVHLIPTGTYYIKDINQKIILANLHELQEAGVKAYSSGSQANLPQEFLLNAMYYTTATSCPIILNLIYNGTQKSGQINEGEVAISIGLRGIPTVIEKIELLRIIELSKYTGSKVHIQCITSADSVEIIRQAKCDGMIITCGTTAHHLMFTENNLSDFDTNFKLNPPLRTEEDRQSLILAVLDGTIDVICSNHEPHESDEKAIEFPLAAFGTSGIQTLFQQSLTILGMDRIGEWLPALTSNPKNIFSLDYDSTESFFLFDSNSSFELNKNTNQSKSIHHPLFQNEIKGKILMVKNKNKVHILDY